MPLFLFNKNFLEPLNASPVLGTGHPEANKSLHRTYIRVGTVSTNQQIKMLICRVKGATNRTTLRVGLMEQEWSEKASLRKWPLSISNEETILQKEGGIAFQAEGRAQTEALRQEKAK